MPNNSALTVSLGLEIQGIKLNPNLFSGRRRFSGLSDQAFNCWAWLCPIPYPLIDLFKVNLCVPILHRVIVSNQLNKTAITWSSRIRDDHPIIWAALSTFSSQTYDDSHDLINLSQKCHLSALFLGGATFDPFSRIAKDFFNYF